jgi:predicted phosphodiesterase
MGSETVVWGLISDIHGNYPALERAVALLQRAGATRLAFLGDYLGRGDSERCVQLIRDTASLAVAGNRDYDWQDRVSASVKDWVLSLPRSVSVGALLLSHGDSRLTPALGTSQIARDFERAWQEMERVGAAVWAFGHSHQARIWRKERVDGTIERIAAGRVEIQPGQWYFVNVGTAGLPFPGKGGPSVALVDFERSVIQELPLGAGTRA